jgi:hypothetical protein
MNKYWKDAALLFSVVSITVLGTTARTARSVRPTGSPSSAQEEATSLQETRRVASEALRLQFDEKVEPVHSANFSGLRSENLTFTRRLDSRTFLAYDRRFSRTSEFGVYREPDETFLKETRRVLEALRVPSNEIESAKILQEKTQAGHRDNSGKISLEQVELGKKYALVARRVGRNPVFSSRAMIGLRRDGQIGFLEVHWPEIPSTVLQQADRYREAVENGWRAPQREGAHVESVAAGIIHSPAAATALDIYPVIRVIYAPDDRHIGKKPVGYFDLDGKTVPFPRTLLEPPREEINRERMPPKR